MDFQKLGEQELELLRFISGNAPMSVRDVVLRYGEPRNLARTTILTMMDRLRKKGFLQRELVEGMYQYSPQISQMEIINGLIQEFVDKTLAGSISPFVAYMMEQKDLSDDEINQLRQLLDKQENSQ